MQFLVLCCSVWESNGHSRDPTLCFFDDRANIHKRSLIPKVRKAVGPDDGVEFRVCFLQDDWIERHGEEHGLEGRVGLCECEYDTLLMCALHKPCPSQLNAFWLVH